MFLSGPVEKREIRKVPLGLYLEGLPNAAPTLPAPRSPGAGACQALGVREQDGAPLRRAQNEGAQGGPSLTRRRWLFGNPHAANSLGSGVITAFSLWALHFSSKSAPHSFLMMSPILTSYILKVDLQVKPSMSLKENKKEEEDKRKVCCGEMERRRREAVASLF